MATVENGLAKRITSWSRRPETRASCLGQEWCDAVFDSPEEACSGSELIVICTPVETIVPLLDRIAPSIARDVIITDVGSTKSRICREARGIDLRGSRFIGSHPMAGSEQTGMAHARADLFEGAACMVTPMDDTPVELVDTVTHFWKRVGMLVTHTSPERHDEIVAHISHLPHLLASTLCSYLARQDHSWHQLAGGGLRDSTRIAAGDPALWRQILTSNKEEVLRAIDGFDQELHRLRTALLNHDEASIQKQLAAGKDYREQIRT
jgi:prephenate dehydrogenase